MRSAFAHATRPLNGKLCPLTRIDPLTVVPGGIAAGTSAQKPPDDTSTVTAKVPSSATVNRRESRGQERAIAIR